MRYVFHKVSPKVLENHTGWRLAYLENISLQIVLLNIQEQLWNLSATYLSVKRGIYFGKDSKKKEKKVWHVVFWGFVLLLGVGGGG